MDDQPKDNNLLQFIATTVESMREDIESVREEVGSVRDQMVTKDDLAQMATKDDLFHVEMRLNVRMDRLELKLEADTTAIRGDIEQVHMRLDNIDRQLSTRLDQLEAEVSRLRSAVYLLAKDRPEILRLLGQ